MPTLPDTYVAGQSGHLQDHTSIAAVITKVIDAALEYGVIADGREVFDAAITAGTATLSSATAAFTPDDVGKAISVQGAGIGGGWNHATTIVGYVSATQVTLGANAVTTVSGAEAAYGTDVTAELNAAIAAAKFASVIQGGNRTEVQLPEGMLMIAGAVQNAGTLNGQLVFTKDNLEGSPAAIRLRGRGAIAPVWYVGAVDSDFRPPMTGTVVYSTLNGRGDASYPGVFSAGIAAGGYPGDYALNAIELVDFTVRTQDVFNGVAVNLAMAGQAYLRNVAVDVAAITPANLAGFTGGFGVMMPAVNNAARSVIDGLYVLGKRTGLSAAEHTNVYDAAVFKSYIAYQINGGQNQTITFQRAGSYNCGYALYAAGSGRIFFDGHIMVERNATGAGGGYAFVEDVHDPSNQIYGIARLCSIIAGSGVENEPVINGGSRLRVERIGKIGHVSTPVNRQTGDKTLTSTTWASLDTGLNQVLHGRVNDVIAITLGGLWYNQAQSSAIDAVSMVSGSPVNSLARRAAYNAAAVGDGFPSWAGASGIYFPFGGTLFYSLQAGDIATDGSVTIQFYYKVTGSKVLGCSANDPLIAAAVNLGQPIA